MCFGKICSKVSICKHSMTQKFNFLYAHYTSCIINKFGLLYRFTNIGLLTFVYRPIFMKLNTLVSKRNFEAHLN